MSRAASILALVAMTSTAMAQDATIPFPDPLPVPDFELPEATSHTLSNGLDVRIVENHEVPLWSARLVVRGGTGTDPADKAGLASVAIDLLDDGAGDWSSSDISRTVKRLGSSLSTSAGLDSSSVSAGGILRNMDETLGIMATVVTQPTFPAEEWSILQQRRIANATAKLEDPGTVGREAFYKQLYDGTYQGSVTTAESYEAITLGDMTAFHAAQFRPSNALLLVGGDIDPATALPILEKHFGGWTVEGQAMEIATPAPAPIEESVMYFIDKPGAAQSVIRLGGFVGTRMDDDYYALHIGNAAFGGAFTARVNMNLREDKGYTYGARCRAWYPEGPGVWFCSTSVRTDATGASLDEIKMEITDVLGDRPIDADELAYNVSSEVNGFPGQYETVGAVLGEHADIWVHGLPSDWQGRYLPGVQAVTVDSANAALAARLVPDRVVWTVVGDRDAVYSDLEAFGLPIIELDRQGNPIQGN